MRLRQRRRRPSDARRRRAGHPGRPGPSGTASEARRRRLPDQRLAADLGGTPRRRAGRGAGVLGRSRREAAGAADRRDRLAGGRHASVGAAAAASVLPPAAGRLSPERGAVRRARRAGLPHPLEFGQHHDLGRQRLQRQGRVTAPGRLLARRSACAARPAHRRNGPVVFRRRAGRGVDPDSGPAVAGQRAGLPDVLPHAVGDGPRRDQGRRGGGQGSAHPAPRHASGPADRQAEGGPRMAGSRADPGRQRRVPLHRPGRRVRPGFGADRPRPARSAWPTRSTPKWCPAS